MSSEYRIKEIKYIDGNSIFIPQKKILFWWSSMSYVSSLIGVSYTYKFDTKEEALDKIKRSKEYIDRWTRVETKYHEL